MKTLVGRPNGSFFAVVDGSNRKNPGRKNPGRESGTDTRETERGRQTGGRPLLDGDSGDGQRFEFGGDRAVVVDGDVEAVGDEFVGVGGIDRQVGLLALEEDAWAISSSVASSMVWAKRVLRFVAPLTLARVPDPANCFSQLFVVVTSFPENDA